MITQSTTTQYLAIWSLVTREDEAIVLDLITARLPSGDKAIGAACRGGISLEVQLQLRTSKIRNGKCECKTRLCLLLEIKFNRHNKFVPFLP